MNCLTLDQMYQANHWLAKIGHEQGLALEIEKRTAQLELRQLMVNTHLPHPRRDGELFISVDVCQSCLDARRDGRRTFHHRDDNSQCQYEEDWPELIQAIDRLLTDHFLRFGWE